MIKKKYSEQVDFEDAIKEEFSEFIKKRPYNLAGYTIQNVTGHVFMIQWVVNDRNDAQSFIDDVEHELPSFDEEVEDYEDEEEIQSVGRKKKAKK